MFSASEELRVRLNTRQAWLIAVKVHCNVQRGQGVVNEAEHEADVAQFLVWNGLE
jgi:hypothetical protein